MSPASISYSGPKLRRPLLLMAAVAAAIYGQAYLRRRFLWKRVDAVVLDTGVVPLGTLGHADVTRMSSSVPQVHFRYYVNSVPYTGWQLRQKLLTYQRLSRAREEVARYKPRNARKAR